jgi:hypothetical protein
MRVVGTVHGQRRNLTLWVVNIYGQIPPRIGNAWRNAYSTKEWLERRKEQQLVTGRIYPWAVFYQKNDKKTFSDTFHLYPTLEAAEAAAVAYLEKQKGDGRPVTLHYELPLSQARRSVAIPPPSFDEYVKLLANTASSRNMRNAAASLKKLRKLRSTAEMVISAVDQVEKNLFELAD